MTSLIADRIRAHLNTVTQLREARQGDPALAERVQGLFDEGAPLASLADAAEPLLDALDTHEWLAWVVVALPALLVLAPVALLTRGGKKGGKAGKKSAAPDVSRWYGPQRNLFL